MKLPPSLPRPSDKWIPWYFVIFFVVLALTLFPMAYVAVHTNTGVVTEDAYDKGLAYNDDIAKGKEQEALGWKGILNVEPIHGSQDVVADFSLTDREGKPLTIRKAKIWFIRPTQDGHDQVVEMLPAARGHVNVKVTLPMPGQWEVRVAAKTETHDFQLIDRVVVP